MTIIVIDPPGRPVVSLEEIKGHLRVDHDNDDAYLESLVEVAMASLDGPAGWLGRCLVEQTLEWRGPGFGPCDGRLPYPPLIDVISVKYDDANGIEQTVSPAEYRLIGSEAARLITLVNGHTWPSARNDSEAVRIRYRSGWPVILEGDGDEQVATWGGPAPIRHAVMLIVAELYQNREAASDTERAELPFAVTALLSTYRVWM